MEYPNSGVLWTANNKKHEKAPDHYGDINIDKDLLQELIANSTGQLVQVKLDGWVKEGRNGNFISLKVNTYKKPEEKLPYE